MIAKVSIDAIRITDILGRARHRRRYEFEEQMTASIVDGFRMETCMTTAGVSIVGNALSALGLESKRSICRRTYILLNASIALCM